jgi:hypothetical protein
MVLQIAQADLAANDQSWGVLQGLQFERLKAMVQ